MAQYTPYALSILPTTSIDVNGIYFIPDSSGAKFNVFIRKNDNSVWINLGLVNSVDSVNGLPGSVQLDLALSASGVLSLTGSSVTIDLDGRYRKSADPVPWSAVSGAPTFALDSAALHKTGNETKSGVLTLTNSPVVPTATAANQAVNKGQMDTADTALQTQIDNLTTAVNSGMKTPLPLDCSTNPNYPASDKGDTYQVTVPGKIGGASGLDVQIGDTIVCTANNAGGTQAAVGANYYILQANLTQATENVSGYAKVATQAKVDAGSDDQDFVTSKKLQQKVNDNNTSQTAASDGKYVRYDAAQTLSAAQRTQAQQNINAASDGLVIHNTGAENVGGVKSFTSIPVLPGSNPTTDNQAARKKYVDDTVAAAVSWGGPNGKEW